MPSRPLADAQVSNLLLQWSALLSGVPHKALGIAGWLDMLGLTFGALERWRPIRQRRFLRRDLGQDIGYHFLGGRLPPFFTVLVAGAVAWLASGLVPAGFYAWVGGLPLWLPILVLGLRQPADMEAIVAIYASVSTVWAFFVHSNLTRRPGWLEQIVVTPAFHHWHHADDSPASLNRNYASLFPWIDRLFGTYHLPADSFPSSYGTNRRLPPTLTGQLLSPFLQVGTAPAAAHEPQALERPADR